MPVLKTNCHWKAVSYLAGRSVAASLLRVSIKVATVQTTTVQLYKLYSCTNLFMLVVAFYFNIYILICQSIYPTYLVAPNRCIGLK
jgi:hypothetical protein